MICVHCQTPLPEGSRYCLSCGSDLSDPGGDRRAVDTVADIRQHLHTALAGQYQIRELLGRGGMGTVFLADDLKLGREVAIKVLPPRLAAEDSFVARFVQEARTSARLDHPNIIPIYAVHAEGDMPYFVMKYVAGRSLEDLIATGPLPFDACRRLLVEAAAALAHAHRKGVIHRDIKPSNIMVDETGRVLLADFGISKALEASASFTGTGHLVGTPAYMSPEQAKGMKVDGRSDQYSLAVVGYQLACGAPLFAFDTPNAAMYQHVHEPPASVRDRCPDVPEAFAAALLRALSKDPADRFPSMEDFAAAIWPEYGGPGTPATDGWSGNLRQRADRRYGIGIAGALGLAAVLGVVALLWPHATQGPAARNSITTESATTPGPIRPAPAAPAPSTRLAAPASMPRPMPTVGDFPRPPAPAKPPTPAVGYITIDVGNGYGMLSIDGVDIRNTPVNRYPVAPGRHVIRVSRDGYTTWTDTVTIDAGNETPRTARLTALP